VASGFADDTATWNGGTLPASTDDLYTNTFTVTIRSNLTANSLKKISASGITAGGSFAVTSSPTITVTAGILDTDNATNATSVVNVSGSGNPTIIGNVRSGAQSSSGLANGRHGIQVDSGFTGNLTVTGNLSSGDTAGWFTSYAIYSLTATGTVTINGNGTPGAARWSPVIGVNGAGLITVNGDLAGGANGGAHAVDLVGGVLNLTVNGKFSGGSASSAYGVNLVSGKVATIRCTSLTPGSFNSSGVGSVAIVSRGTAFRFSGTIYSGGVLASTGPSGYFPIDGAWAAITGEDVAIEVYNDSNFPANNSGTTRTLSTGGSSGASLSDILAGTGAQIAAATSG
jgi:hypothetical protein